LTRSTKRRSSKFASLMAASATIFAAFCFS